MTGNHAPDHGRGWVRKHSPDDPYLAPAEPRRDPRAKDLASRLQALAPAATTEEAEARVAWLHDHPGMRLLVLPLGTKPPGLDGRVSTCLGRLTEDQYHQARKSGLIDQDGALVAKPPAVTKTKRVPNRRGSANYAVAVLREEHEAAKQVAAAAEAYAAQVRSQLLAAQREQDQQWKAEHTKPRDPRLRAYRWHEGSVERLPDPEDAVMDELVLGEEDWLIWAVDDRYDAMAAAAGVPNDLDDEPDYAGHPTPSAPELELTELGARELARRVTAEARRMEDSWRGEITAHRAAGDERFVPEPMMCKHPSGRCPNRLKNGRGSRCPACAKWALEHDGEWRPLPLVNKDRRRKGL